jgi:hypothetical protein
MPMRFDAVPLGQAKKLPNGWLKAPATFTRCGVLLYRRPDGTVRRELRLPEEVFRQDSLETLELVPITDRHPPEKLLDATTTKARQVGQVGDKLRQDGDLVAGSVMVTDAGAVEKVEAGRDQLSCGYECRSDAAPGVHPVYGPYDVIQRDIRYNHVALVPVARAGPEARIHLDAEDAELVEAERPPVEIPSVDVELPETALDVD